MRIRVIVWVGMFALLFFTQDAPAGWMQDQLKTIKNTKVGALKTTSLSETTIGDGLKEALKVGIDNTIKLTGKTDGFLKNDLIRISMPEKLKLVDKGLRAVGFSQPIDEFVLSMNRAAEAATPQAKDIFINAIMEMSFDDVMKIYNGGNTSATEFFKEKTSAKLRNVFLPIVKKSLSQYDVTGHYDAIMQKYRSLPFSSNMPAPDVEQYVLDQTLNGLFLILGQEETKIRTEPGARVTSLLKDVFN